MPRTRRQVTLQEQESGVPASPPQSLPTATRPRRTTTRNNNNDNNINTTAAPVDPPNSTRGGAATRGGRIGKPRRLGRNRTQPPVTLNHDAPESSATDVDGTEASDSITQNEVTVQATPTPRNVPNDQNETGDREETNVESFGETQSPTGVSAHPVQVQDVTAQPVHGPTTPQERRESATSLVFKKILNISPQGPSLCPGLPTPNPVTPTIPSTPIPEPSMMAASPASVSSSLSSPLIKPAPKTLSPISPTPVYYMPSNPDYSQSLITIRMDHFQGSKDPVRPSKPAAFAVPSELIAPLCRYIESRATQGSDLSNLTTDHPAVNAIVHGKARYRPQLPSWHSQQSPPLPGSTMKDAFIRRAQRKRCLREVEEESATLKTENAKLNAIAAGELTEPPPKRTKTVPDMWTADGQLMLGRTKEVEVDENGEVLDPTEVPSLRWGESSHFLPPQFPVLMNIVDDTEGSERAHAQNDEARRIATVGESPYAAEEIPDTEGSALGGLFAESQAEVQPEQVPETPRANRWGLSRFLPSAQSVTRYIPFSPRRTTTTPQHQAPQPEQAPQQLTHTETRVNASTSQSQREPERADTVAGPGHRHRESTSNQQRLLTKQQWEEEKRIKRLRLQLRREAEALEKQKRAFELAKKDLAEKQKSADVTETPGQKRKRIPSPDVIPLPAGGGYGMVDEYFMADSSSDDEIVAQETPTKERPSKKARTSTPNDFTVGSPFSARPYTGTLFTHPDAQQPPEDNVFDEANKPDGHPVLDSTPPPGPTLIFKVPSPGSSDSDDDEDDEQDQIIERGQKAPSPSAPAPKSILRNSASNLSQPRPAANSTSPSKSMVPPPRPIPGHATLPAATMTAPSDALEKAREKALKHQPKQPSTLRESSRLSSSTVNSDPGDEGHVEEYDPANPAIVLSPSKAPALRQHDPPTEPVYNLPPVRRVSSMGLQQPVMQAVSEQPHEQQAVAKPNGKQAETIHDMFTHADDLLSCGAVAILAEERRHVLEDAESISTSTSQKIKADLDRWWKQHGDDYVSSEGHKEFEDDLLAEEQELMDVPNGDPYVQPRNIISAALDRIGADGLIDRGIQMDIEGNWRPGDLERTQSDPENGMRVFFNRLVKNGVIEKDLADRVVAIGVPPGITTYLAGQEVMGPMAA